MTAIAVRPTYTANEELAWSEPRTILANSFGTPWMITMAVCATRKAKNRHNPTKCALRATCLPPRKRRYVGKRPLNAGDRDRPRPFRDGSPGRHLRRH